MNNNTENKNKTIKFSDDFEVSEYQVGENKISSINLNIPFRFDLCGFRGLAEYKDIAQEDVRIKQSVIFELIQLFGEEMRGNDCSKKFIGQIAEFLLVLGQIGKGLSEASEIIDLSFERYHKAQAEKKPEVAA